MRLTRLAPLLAALLTALWLAPVAFAHAHYVTSNPASGAHLAAAPSSLSITYDDALDPNSTVLHVLGPGGKDVTAGKTVVTIEATKVATVAITPAGAGTYTVNWHAVADDDKGVTEGTFTFTVGAAAASPAAATNTGAAATIATAPLLPSSGGGGMALGQEELQAAVSLAVALAVGMGLILLLRPRSG
ncbi:MAG TPA: copper resistance protein CopC, partial [Chloroflexota bacterium]|nr:copper resistance protein CopC [Chloroflexota bacterium]